MTEQQQKKKHEEPNGISNKKKHIFGLLHHDKILHVSKSEAEKQRITVSFNRGENTCLDMWQVLICSQEPCIAEGFKNHTKY